MNLLFSSVRIASKHVFIFWDISVVDVICAKPIIKEGGGVITEDSTDGAGGFENSRFLFNSFLVTSGGLVGKISSSSSFTSKELLSLSSPELYEEVDISIFLDDDDLLPRVVLDFLVIFFFLGGDDFLEGVDFLVGVVFRLFLLTPAAGGSSFFIGDIFDKDDRSFFLKVLLLLICITWFWILSSIILL